MDKGFVTALSTAFRMRDMEEVDMLLLAGAPIEVNSKSEIEVAVSDARLAYINKRRTDKINALRAFTNAAAKTIICALCFFVIRITSADAVPIPEFKPSPWWVPHIAKTCTQTKIVLAELSKTQAKPLFWSRIRVPGTSKYRGVAQLWGVEMGDLAERDGWSWSLFIHFNNGVTCPITRGQGLPGWASYPNGRPT